MDNSQRKTRSVTGRDPLSIVDLPLTIFGKNIEYSNYSGSGASRKVVINVYDPSSKRSIKGNVEIISNYHNGSCALYPGDEDILLAMCEIGGRDNFNEQEVKLKSINELMKYIGWPRSAVYYQKVWEGCTRLRSVVIRTDCYLNRQTKILEKKIFGILDEATQLAEDEKGTKVKGFSWRWNHTFWLSLKSQGYRYINMDIYRKIKNPVAKKLYRVINSKFNDKWGIATFRKSHATFPVMYLSQTILQLNAQNVSEWYYRDRLKEYGKLLKKVGAIEDFKLEFNPKFAETWVTFYESQKIIQEKLGRPIGSADRLPVP